MAETSVIAEILAKGIICRHAATGTDGKQKKSAKNSLKQVAIQGDKSFMYGAGRNPLSLNQGGTNA